MSEDRALSVSVPSEGRPARRLGGALRRHGNMLLFSFGVIGFGGGIVGGLAYFIARLLGLL